MLYSLRHKQTMPTDLFHQNIHLNVYLSEIGIRIDLIWETQCYESQRQIHVGLKISFDSKMGDVGKILKSLSLFAYAYQLRQDQSKQSQTQYMREKQKWADQKRQKERWGVEKDPSHSWVLIKTPCTFH